ncbi:hypothetical protein BV898_16919 [Hypsibius exemplaris]|uniref:Uncharacterized protein n=1 Tax=Hypsibius exemplaris TaxID=2072580 RepID=A0A9X6NLD8_HYPEX|nr:hypothetical protein BV898_16919 [Hypsibius exemplaris]
MVLTSLLVVCACLSIFHQIKSLPIDTEDSGVRAYLAPEPAVLDEQAGSTASRFIDIEPAYPYNPYENFAEDNSIEAGARGKRFFSILSPADRLRTLYARTGKMPRTLAGSKVSLRNGIPRYAVMP